MSEPFLVFPELETERLRLEQLSMDDLSSMYEIKSDYEVTSRYGTNPHANMVQTEGWMRIVLEDYKEKRTLFWKIVNKMDNRIAGTVTLWNMDLESGMAELGYELHPDYWKKGIMTEAIYSILGWAFEIFGLNRVEACPYEMNTDSRRLLEKLGFKREGILRERRYFNGRFLDQYYYALLKKEWSEISRQHRSVG